MHIGAVSSVVAGTVGLCTDIQPLTAQSRIIGRGFHGVNRIDIFQRPAGHNDQGRVDLNGVCTFLAVDPLLICFNSQNGTLLGLIQREMNVKGAQARSILHAGNRNPVNLLLIAVQERDRAVFIQDSGKTAAFQQKVKPVTFLRLIDNDGDPVQRRGSSLSCRYSLAAPVHHHPPQVGRTPHHPAESQPSVGLPKEW